MTVQRQQRRRRSMAPCSARGCPVLTRDSYCTGHAPEPWAGRRGFTGYKGRWMQVRRQVMREEPTCRACGKAPSVTVDHIKPRAEGGGEDRSNLQALCDACRRRKDAQDAARGRQRAFQARRGEGGPKG